MIEKYFQQQNGIRYDSSRDETNERRIAEEMVDEVRDDMLAVPCYKDALLTSYSPFRDQEYGFFAQINNLKYIASYKSFGGNQRILHLRRDTQAFPYNVPLASESVEIATCVLDGWETYPHGRSYLLEHTQQETSGISREVNNIAAFNGARGLIAEFQTIFSLYE